jgi:hypothetical protein
MIEFKVLSLKDLDIIIEHFNNGGIYRPLKKQGFRII